MKIAFISQPWEFVNPPAQGGSLVIWNYQVARRLAAKHEILVYARRRGDQPQSRRFEDIEYRWKAFPGEELALKGFRFIERVLGYPRPKSPFFSTAGFYLGYALRIARDMRSQGCDIVHIQNHSQFAPIIRALNPGVKIVLNMHCDWLSQLDKGMIERRLRQIDLIVGCSNHVTNLVKQRFPAHAGKCVTVPNGVDPDVFRPSDNLEEDGDAVAGGMRKLLFVGRISPEKGIHVLLEAFKQVHRASPDVELEIVGPIGEGAYEYMALVSDDPNVKGLAAFYHGVFKRLDYIDPLRGQIPPEMHEKVHFLGPIPHSRLTAHYQQADMLINPSLTEAFGMSLVEAMASGIPVVATRVGGMVDIVQDGLSGVLVEANDPADLAAGILRILQDEDLRHSMGRAGLQLVPQFNWDRIAGMVEGHYADLLA